MRTTGRLLAAIVLTIAFAPPGTGADEPKPKPTDPTITEVGGRSLVQWMSDLKSDDASVREEAIRAVALFPGPHAGELVTLLLNRCQDKDTSLRVRAVMALSVLDVKKDEVPRIVKAMIPRLTAGFGRLDASEPQVIVRFHAAVCLLRFGESSKDALAALLKGAEDVDSFEIRRTCIRALESCGNLANGSPDPRVTNVLLNRCYHTIETTAQVRLEAVIALGGMGRSGDVALHEKSVKVLQTLTGDPEKIVGIWALVSWMAIDKPSEAGIAKIKGYLSAPELRIRINAIQALGIVGARVKTVIPTLIELLEDRNPAIVICTCGTLAVLRDGAKPALPALTALLTKPGVEKDIKAAAEGAMKLIQMKLEK